jgi:hypothetical protein
VDVWDGDAGDPVVYNGYTTTSKVSLDGCLKAIAEFGASMSGQGSH